MKTLLQMEMYYVIEYTPTSPLPIWIKTKAISVYKQIFVHGVINWVGLVSSML